MLKLSTFVACLGLSACLFGSASAQVGYGYDYSNSTEYRTYTRDFNWSPDVRTSFQTTVRSQSNDLYPIFYAERTELWPILTPEQRIIYDRYHGPNSYYSLGLMTPTESQEYRRSLATELNLTPEQEARYEEIQSRTWSAVTPIQDRYSTTYLTSVSPTEWETYRTSVTSGYMNDVAFEESASSNLQRESSTSSSTEIEERRHVEISTEQTVPVERVSASPAAPAPRPGPRNSNWRNQDLK